MPSSHHSGFAVVRLTTVTFLQALSLAFAFAVPANARTLIVSVAGADSADGTDAKPYRTISAAAAFAQPGDTILVKPGIYRERVTPPRGGEPQCLRRRADQSVLPDQSRF